MDDDRELVCGRCGGRTRLSVAGAVLYEYRRRYVPLCVACTGIVCRSRLGRQANRRGLPRALESGGYRMVQHHA